jgi:6-phosphofructokinase 1
MGTTSDLSAAILFSGGDAPGMNPLLRAFVRLGHKRYQARVFGIKDGYLGLMRASRRLECPDMSREMLWWQIAEHPGRLGMGDRAADIILMDDHSVARIIDRGGIVLGSSRCPEFHEPEVRCRAIRLLEMLGIERLVVVGGEGSLKGAADLGRESHLCTIGIPATIDNDFALSERSLGFDTAANTVVSCVRQFNDTAGSHHRIMVLEIMGRQCGELAETAALASGAEIVVTPERGPLTAEKMLGIAERIEKSMVLGRTHAIVLVTEKVEVDPPSEAGPTKTLSDFLEQYFHREGSLFGYVDTRYSVLGHLQRGGAPTAADRLLAADFAEAAWEALAAPKQQSGVLGLVHGQVRLQEFGSQPGPERAARIQRIYQLQKDVSKYHKDHETE